MQYRSMENIAFILTENVYSETARSSEDGRAVSIWCRSFEPVPGQGRMFHPRQSYRLLTSR